MVASGDVGRLRVPFNCRYRSSLWPGDRGEIYVLFNKFKQQRIAKEESFINVYLMHLLVVRSIA